ncbi:MAG: hypothetical protein ABII80_01475 [bacterium]
MKKTSKLWQWLSHSNWIAVLLIGLVGWLGGRANYQAGKYLLGWDSVWSEANIGLSFKRALSGLWQEFQGVGLQGGHGYVSDLIHTTWLWLISIFVPLVQVRYVSVVLLWMVGAWGGYFLISRLTNKWLAMISSFVYMFHPFIVQQFFVPHDSFIWLFAFLPWSLLAIISLLENWSYKRLFYVFLTQILLSFAGFIPPQMLAYLMVVGVLLICYLLGEKGRWKKVLGLGLVIFAVHSFWFLPFVRYGISGSGTYLKSKLNTITTPENDLKSESFGGWGELITGKSYYFESLDIVDDQIMGSAPIFTEWASYWSGKPVVGVLFGLFGVATIGWFTMFWQRKWWKWGMGASFILVISGIANRAWPLGYLGKIFHFLPIIDQAFRIGFTKFSIIYVLLLGIFVAFGLEIIGKLLHKRVLMFLGGVAVIGGMLLVGWPVFQGKMFYARMRVELPSEYIHLIEFMKSQKADARIAALPVQTYNGWQINSWGYTGSGFLFYGVEQSILDRAFDVWSPYNEGFYEEFSTAIYGANTEGVKRVLDKYDVRYVLLDESVSAPGQGKEILRIPETKKLAEELGWEEKFREGFLTVWEVPSETGLNQFLSAPNSWKEVGVDASKARRDVVMEEEGTYVTGVNQITYPFASLMKEEVKGVEYESEGVTISVDTTGSKLEIPGFKQGQKVEMQYKISYENETITITWEPIYVVNGSEGPKLTESEYLINDKDSLWVKIGANEAKFVRKGEVITGSASLSVGEPIRTEIYDGKGKQERVDGGWSDGDASVCGEDSKYSCWSMPLMRAGRRELIQVILHYKSVTGKIPRLCLDLEGDPYQCENLVQTGLSPIIVTQETGVGEKYWMDIVVGGKKGDIELREPGIVRYPFIRDEAIGNEGWESFLNNQEHKIGGGKVEVTVNAEPKRYDFGSLGKKEMNNCDLLSRGKVSKSLGSELAFTLLQKTENPEAGLTKYTAQERGAICDYVEMSELQTQLSYLMRIRGENREGRSVKLFFYNTGSERNDLEYLLDKESFDQTFAVLPWEFPGSYSLNIETRSFGQPTENAIYPVAVRYFPLEQIARATINSGLADPQLNENGLDISEVKKIGTWLYKVKYTGEGMVKLSQGYDEGWIAWSGGKLLEHKKIDGWSNGWIVPRENGKTLVILYWPQLLEYFGFGMLGVVGWQLGKRREK